MKFKIISLFLLGLVLVQFSALGETDSTEYHIRTWYSALNGDQGRVVEGKEYPLTLAWRTDGILSPEKDNIILLFHGRNGSKDSYNDSIGSPKDESTFIEHKIKGDRVPRAYNSDKFFIISIDAAGNPNHSSNYLNTAAPAPYCQTPLTLPIVLDGIPYIPTEKQEKEKDLIIQYTKIKNKPDPFPQWDIRFLSECAGKILKYLEVDHVYTVGGGSMGGYQSIQFLVDNPEISDKLIFNLSAPYTGIGLTLLHRRNVMTYWRSPDWNNGNFYHNGTGIIDYIPPRKAVYSIAPYNWLDDESEKELGADRGKLTEAILQIEEKNPIPPIKINSPQPLRNRGPVLVSGLVTALGRKPLKLESCKNWEGIETEIEPDELKGFWINFRGESYLIEGNTVDSVTVGKIPNYFGKTPFLIKGMVWPDPNVNIQTNIGCDYHNIGESAPGIAGFPPFNNSFSEEDMQARIKAAVAPIKFKKVLLIGGLDDKTLFPRYTKVLRNAFISNPEHNPEDVMICMAPEYGHGYKWTEESKEDSRFGINLLIYYFLLNR